MNGVTMDSGRRRRDARPMTALGRLIYEQRSAHRMSLDDVVAAAKRSGYTVSKSRISQLETEPVPTWPRAEIVKGLAAALKVPERVIVAALVESMGLDLPQMPSAEWLLLIAKGERLSPARRRHLITALDALISENDVGADQ